MKKATLWELFSTFFKIGLFTFGGGYAMLSVIEHEVVTRKQWLTDDEMLSLVVIAESTPGTIACNSATFVGCRTRGILGALVATLGMVLPSFVIISALFFVLDALKDNVWFVAAFKGVSCCVIVLVLNAFIKLFSSAKLDVFGWLVMIACALLTLFTDFSVILLLICAAAFGVVVFYVKNKGAAK